MKNLYLDPITKDLKLTTLKDLRLTETTSEFVSQKIENKLSFFSEEWFLNYLLGIFYFQKIFKKNPDINLITTILRNEVENIIEIIEIITFEVEFDTTNRIYDLNMEVKIGEDDTVTFQAYI